jgi:hypothetical protein
MKTFVQHEDLHRPFELWPGDGADEIAPLSRDAESMCEVALDHVFVQKALLVDVNEEFVKGQDSPRKVQRALSK